MASPRWPGHARLTSAAAPADCPAPVQAVLGARTTITRVSHSTVGATIGRRPDASEPVSLSYAQEGIWIADQLKPGESTFTTPIAVRFRGALVLSALRSAVDDVVDRHELLRSTIHSPGGRPRQVVRERRASTVPVSDLTMLPAAERYPRALEAATAEATRAIDTARGVLRARLYRLAPDDHLLFLAVHHIAWDGWSISIFFRELSVGYRARTGVGGTDLPDLPIQYADYARWQRDVLSPDELAGDLDYWRGELAGELTAVQLPTEQPLGRRRSDAADVVAHRIPQATMDRASAFARAERVSPFMVVKTALHVLLRRLTAQPTITTVFPWANRPRVELEHLIGLFVNQLTLRTDFVEEASFGTILPQVRSKVLRGFGHAGLPYERLVRELGIDREPGRNPLDQVRLGFQNATDASLLDLPGVHTEVVELHSGAGKEKLDLVAWEQPGAGLELVASYNTDLLDAHSVSRLLQRLEIVLAAGCADRDRPIDDLPLLVPGEEVELRRVGGCAADAAVGEARDEADGEGGGDGTGTLYERVAARAARAPAAEAVLDRGRSLSYAALLERSDVLARVLAEHGVRRGWAVALHLGRGADFVVAALAVVSLGAHYLPLDPTQPPARIAVLIEDTAPAAVVAAASTRATLPAPVGPPVVLVSDRPAGRASVRLSTATGEDPAYVMYTSGSTGRPKGATVSHDGVLAMVRHQQLLVPLRDGDRVQHRAPLDFDVSVIEIFWPLSVGATVVAVPPEEGADVRAVAARARSERVTALFAVPSVLKALLATDPDPLPDLRAVFCTGESLAPELVGRIRELAPEAQVVNVYGATEASIYSTTWSMGPDDEVPEQVPIGRVIAGARAHVLDARMRPLPFGARGELYLGGDAVTAASGYVRRPRLSAERFVPDPFTDAAGRRLYRTGDLVRMRGDGTLFHLGRIDRQLKRGGVRIEPAEVQALLEEAVDVEEAFVTLRTDEGAQHLVAYVVGRAGGPLDVPALQRRAVAELPRQMVPSRVVVLDRMPLTANGKLDMAALPAPQDQGTGASTGARAPHGATERQVVSAVAALLGLDRVGVDDDFFLLGGTSIQGAELAHRLGRDLGVPADVRAVFETRSISELAARLDAAEDAGADGADRVDLQAETRLDPAISARGLPPAVVGEAPCVLLTGATGFLGAFLLRELLDRTRSRVRCLVRAADDAAAQRRLREALDDYGLDGADLPVDRVTAISGDLARPALGLGATSFAALAQEIDLIVHNGARVNHLDSYARLRAPNVAGTAEILRLATTGRLKPVHHVSTSGLAHSVRGDPPVVPEERRVAADELLPGGYVASKWVAEEMVHAAGERGVPVAVYRPGRVCGHADTGAGGLQDAFWNLIRAMVVLGAAPETSATADLVPVDHVAGAVVHLAGLPASIGTTYHLTSPQPTAVRTVIDELRALGHRLESLPAPEWSERLAGADDAATGLVAAQARTTPGPAPAVLGRENTRRALAGTTVSPAEIGPGTIARYLEHLTDCGFLPAPRARGGSGLTTEIGGDR